MKMSHYNRYEELPLFLNARQVAEILGISLSSSYELMKENDFPSLRIGSRIVIPREDFQSWITENVKRGTHGT